MEVKELIELIDKAWDQDKVVKGYDKQKKDANALLDEMKGKILNHLDEHDLANFATSTCLASSALYESVKFPKEISAKQKVFDYITEKYGKATLLGYLKIDSATFNTFFKAEAAAAFEKDENLDFKIEGVEEAKGYTKLKMKKVTKKKGA